MVHPAFLVTVLIVLTVVNRAHMSCMKARLLVRRKVLFGRLKMQVEHTVALHWQDKLPSRGGN